MFNETVRLTDLVTYYAQPYIAAMPILVLKKE